MLFAINACGKTEEETVNPLTQKAVTETKTQSETHQTATSEPTTIVTSQGYKNVTFGMTELEANSAYLGGLEKSDYYDESEKECYYLYPNNIDYMKEHVVAFMVVSGTIQRIDIGSTKITTERGAKIGMKFEDIEALYPNTERKPNFYTYPDEDLFVLLSSDTKAIFEQNNNKTVSQYRVGKTPAVEYLSLIHI